MKILAFAASNSRESINRALVDLSVRRFLERVDSSAVIEKIDLNDYEMPIYSIDRERADGIPKPATELFAMIGNCDGVLVSYAEHNGLMTAAWKNIFDWMSRQEAKLWQGKKLLFLAATPGPRSGAGVLESQAALAPFFGGDVRATLGIGRWQDAYDPSSQALTRTEDADALDAALDAFSE